MHSSQKGVHTMFLLYEPGHVEELERFWQEQPNDNTDSFVVALTSEIEEKLTGRNIAFSSGREYRPLDANCFMLSEERVNRMFTSMELKWFQYRGVELLRIFSVSIQLYFARFLYYEVIMKNLVAKYPHVRRIVVFPSLLMMPIKSRTLMRQQFDLVVDCARMVGSQRGIEVFVPQTAIREDPPRVNGISFALACAYTELGVRIYNACIFLLHPRRGTPRILASDYWRNIEPVMSRLPQGELVLFDRGEALKAGLRNLWRKRVRLYNFGSFSIRGRKKDRMEIQRLFEDQWRNLRKRGFLESQSDRSSLDSLSIKVFEEILLHSVPQALRDIDSAYAMLDALTPDMVFLRAGVSEQTHFGILAMVAHASRIPSLELQHGVEYLGPGSVSKRHVVEYVAVYGQVVQDEFANLGFPREKFPIVGSPRFDIYKKEVARVRQKHREDMSVSVLCIGFGIEAEWPYDDYSVENYYSAIAKTLEKIPHSSVVIKIRPGSSINSWCRSMIDRIFANVPHRIAEYEPLCELFVSADIVVSYYSTSVLEALQFSKPIIVFSTQPMEKEMIQFRFTQFADAGGLVVAYTRKELETALLSLSGDSAMRDRLARGAKEVLGLFYLFDGKASERVVELIWRLAQRRE